MVDSSQPSKGILFKLSGAPPRPGQAFGHKSSDAPTQSTSSAAFISVSDLEGPPDPDSTWTPIYAHPLESFLYVLAWILYGYSKGEAVDDSLLKEWPEGTDDERAARKRSWLKTPARQKAKQFDGLRKRWLVPLAKMFHEAYEKRGPAPEKGITYERFLAILDT